MTVEKEFFLEEELEKEIVSLQDRYFDFRKNVSEGKFTKEEAEKEMSVFEEKMDEIIERYELEDIIGTTTASKDTYEKLKERISVFSNRYRAVEKVFFQIGGGARDDAFVLQEKYNAFNSDIRRGLLEEEEAKERLEKLNKTMEEIIEKYNKTREVEEALSSVNIFEELGEQLTDLQLFLEKKLLEIEVDEKAQKELSVAREDYRSLTNNILEGKTSKEQAEEKLLEIEEKIKNTLTEQNLEGVYERHIKASRVQRLLKSRDMQFVEKMLFFSL